MTAIDLKNILLINTPSGSLGSTQEKNLPLNKQSRVSVYPPLGVCYLSAFLNANGYRAEILDLEMEIFYLMKKEGVCSLNKVKKLINDKIKAVKPGVVGISCIVSTRYKQAHKIGEIVKSIAEDTIIVLGGNYPTNSPEHALQDKNVDFIVTGEGEMVFMNLLKALADNKGFGSVSGIGYKSGGEIKINERNSVDLITDLDSLPFPDYDRLPIEKYYDIEMSQSLEGNLRFFPLFTSRGCPWQCTFCGARNTFGNRYRIRSAENVLAEIDWLVQKYDMREIQFQDDNLTLDKERAKEIFDGLIKRKDKIPWTAPHGLDVSTLDKPLLEKIKLSGGRDLAIAVESGNERVLRMMNKRIDLNKVKEVVQIMRDLGIYTRAFFILGFPGESKEEMRDTIGYAAGLKADWSTFTIANPLPGTAMADFAAKKGYLANNRLERIGYLNANIETEEFSAKYVEELTYDANIKINFLNNPNLKEGNIDLAIRDFRRIVERYPEHTVARYCLAKALIKRGLIEEGLNELGKVHNWQQNGKDKAGLLEKYNININDEMLRLCITGK